MAMTCFAKIFLELVAWTPCRTKRTAAIEIVGAALARIATTPRQPGGDLVGGELGERASRLGWDAEWWRDGSRGWTRDRALAKPRRKCRNAGGTSGENVTAGRAARYRPSLGSGARFQIRTTNLHPGIPQPCRANLPVRSHA